MLKHGRYTVAAEAQRMLDAGLGLSEKEIERFYQRVEAARQRKMQRPAIDPLRQAIEARYREGIS